MSALNHFLFPNGAVLLTDGATAVDGVLTAIRSKVARFPHLNAAVGYTGTSFVPAIVQDFLGQTALTFDALVAGMASEVAEGVAHFAPQMREAGGPETGLSDIVVVGYSTAAAQWQAWQCTFGLHAAPVVTPLPRASLRPWTPEMAAELTAGGLSVDAALEALDSAGARAVPIMEIQRRRAAPHGCVIGAFQEMTILSSPLCISTVATVWPDRLGERVNLS